MKFVILQRDHRWPCGHTNRPMGKPFHIEAMAAFSIVRNKFGKDNNKKGVVGMSGKKAPTTPKLIKVQPSK